MTLQPREKKSLMLLAGALVIAFLVWISGNSSPSVAKVSAPVESVERTSKRLDNLRTALATVNGKEAQLNRATAELAEREKGLIPGDTANQAQAQLLQIVRRVARAQNPQVEIHQFELGQPRSYGDAYGQVTVSVTIDCRIDELVNVLATLSQQPEIVATDEVRLGTANPKSKSMPVQLTISGIVPKRLVPEKKGLASF